MFFWVFSTFPFNRYGKRATKKRYKKTTIVRKSYKQFQRKLTTMGKEEEEPTFEELVDRLEES